MFWLKRAWGYYGDITGAGVINEPVAADSAAHHTALMNLLATETNNNATTELKNAAVFTPLAGALATARDYFANSHQRQASPITQSCQKNFVLLATDGNPTGKTDGSMYTLAEHGQQLQCRHVHLDLLAPPPTMCLTRSPRCATPPTTTPASTSYDVQSYVIGLGDTVANASSIATFNRMAHWAAPAMPYLASDEASAGRRLPHHQPRHHRAHRAAASSVSLNSGSLSNGTKVFQGRFSRPTGRASCWPTRWAPPASPAAPPTGTPPRS
jgi:type IV pilus assembly protein PilY1